MEIHLSRRRTLSEQQRRKKILDPSNLNQTFNEWPMKTRIRIFCPYFEWNESVQLEDHGIIGRGKFSSVLRCRIKDQSQGRDEADRNVSRPVEDRDEEVAVKVLEKSTIISQDMTKQICQERRIQSVCSHHSFVLPLLRVWQDDHRLYMALPLCDRGQLFELWASRRNAGQSFSAVSICVAALQLASALQYIQSLGVIYRDLKLNNVLISRRGDLQVSDFGLSKWLGRHERTRTICGTLAYMAPEILNGTPYGHAADWWSLGILLHCLNAMKFPFLRGPDHNKMLENILGSPIVHGDIENKNEEIGLLLKCLIVIDESERLTSFRQLESCCEPTLTYDQMINNGISFLSILQMSSTECLNRVTTTSEELDSVDLTNNNSSSNNNCSHDDFTISNRPISEYGNEDLETLNDSNLFQTRDNKLGNLETML